eukprot:TRINITY_DN10870_c0_g2_i4.p1 TRINITY_DN10870_c0_g2~~TRINITY_DN10870_c0_g2_i4.p1  ORF type:complete len:282 (+),score=74.72 TRINITY_DN10870_c0_g2_i4:640-1485(+)
MKYNTKLAEYNTLLDKSNRAIKKFRSLLLKYKRLLSEHRGRESELEKALRAAQKSKEAEMKKLIGELNNLKARLKQQEQDSKTPARSRSRGIGRLKNTLTSTNNNRELTRSNSKAETALCALNSKHTQRLRTSRVSMNAVSEEMPLLDEKVQELQRKLCEERRKSGDSLVRYNEALQELNFVEEKHQLAFNKVQNNEKALKEELNKLRQEVSMSMNAILPNSEKMQEQYKAQVKNMEDQLIKTEKEKDEYKEKYMEKVLSLIHICRCRRYAVCRSRWSPYH